MHGIRRPITLTIIRGNTSGRTYQKLIYSISNYKSRLPNLVLSKLLEVLFQLEEYYCVINSKSGMEEYPLSLQITSVNHVKGNRCEIRLNIPNIVRLGDIDEPVYQVFNEFLESMHDGLLSEYRISVYKKGDV